MYDKSSRGHRLCRKSFAQHTVDKLETQQMPNRVSVKGAGQGYVRNLPVGAGEAIMLKVSAVTAAQVPRSQSGFGHFEGSGK